MKVKHLLSETLVDYFEGDLTNDESWEIEEHLAECDRCFRRGAKVQRALQAVAELSPDAIEAATLDYAIARGFSRAFELFTETWGPRLKAMWAACSTNPGRFALQEGVKLGAREPLGRTASVEPRRLQAMVKTARTGKVTVHVNGFADERLVMLVDIKGRRPPQLRRSMVGDSFVDFLSPAGTFLIICEPPS